MNDEKNEVKPEETKQQTQTKMRVTRMSVFTEDTPQEGCGRIDISLEPSAIGGETLLLQAESVPLTPETWASLQDAVEFMLSECRR